MNKQEFIEKLREHGAWCTECHDIHGEKDRYVKVAKVRELLEQLDEPQAEKQEVSQEFADWVKKAKAIKGIADYKSWCVKEIADMGWGNWIHDPNRFVDKEKIYDKWVNTVHENKEKHVKAIYDGYTVKPKRWVVKKGKDCVLTSFTFFNEQSVNYDSNSYGQDYMYFTDKSKAEAVATLVEGSVEEV